ncbi:hypothetical protein [Streptomyces sp. NBC_01565]|uniref:hypothetical protein n=1 Tax=Streptomyces sp. NBC_01565 TaxID=2975881 RepID=UPI002259FCA2|nr:hypothetical protein [Streptomyces sp. NBC_01565]MCX4540464.1 hypothetical protein [Streptomyces sp. NBC_01565]
MLGKKSQQIRNLERLVRIRTAERDEARGDYRAAHADIRSLAQQLADRDAEAAAVSEEQVEADIEHPDELWSLIDWSLWGSGMGDTFRNKLANRFIRAITPAQHEQALGLIQAWTDSGRLPLGRRRYEDQQARLHRALRACARYRRDEAALARHAVALQQRLDHAVGLDSPALDAGARWQERRLDKVKGVVR